jgi:hypothetical protein
MVNGDLAIYVKCFVYIILSLIVQTPFGLMGLASSMDFPRGRQKNGHGISITLK